MITSGPGQNALPGLVGYEFDERAGNSSSLAPYVSAEPLGNRRGRPTLSYRPSDNGVQAWSDATLYTAPSGAQVFSAGTIQWAFTVDNGYNDGWCNCGSNVASAAGQRITSNILNRFTTPLTAPQVTLSPDPHVRRPADGHRAGVTQPVTLTNSGTAALSLSGITVTGTNAGGLLPDEQLPGEPCRRVELHDRRWLPSRVAGLRAASVQITDNARDSPESVSVSGTGTAPTVYARALVAQLRLAARRHYQCRAVGDADELRHRAADDHGRRGHRYQRRRLRAGQQLPGLAGHAGRERQLHDLRDVHSDLPGHAHSRDSDHRQRNEQPAEREPVWERRAAGSSGEPDPGQRELRLPAGRLHQLIGS